MRVVNHGTLAGFTEEARPHVEKGGSARGGGGGSRQNIPGRGQREQRWEASASEERRVAGEREAERERTSRDALSRITA